MTSYEVRQKTLTIGEKIYQVRSLSNLQQFSDDSGVARRNGISSANWSLFGVIWPAGVILARLIDKMPLKSVKMLELGCGLGVTSMVASHRGAEITASDYHPLASKFLAHNTNLNKIRPIKFLLADWAKPITRAGKYELIVGSDILYEQQHPALLSVFIDCHAANRCEVIICDPKRRQLNTFTRMMAERGFGASQLQVPEQTVDGKLIGVNVMSYTRNIDDSPDA